jgi:hypothetical protein
MDNPYPDNLELHVKIMNQIYRYVEGSEMERCIGCNKRKPDAHRRRQNTAYVDDERNWKVLCDKCQEDNDEYWNEMWKDYYDMLRG